MKKFGKVLAALSMVVAILYGTMITGNAAELEEAMDIAQAAVSFSGVKIDATNTGVELVRTSGTTVTVEYLGVDNPNTYTVTNTIKDGVVTVTIKNSNGNPSINFGSDYKNVVRVNIPDARYNTFALVLNQAPVKMQDFNAPIVVDAKRSAVTVSDIDISRGTYNITGNQGNVNITANIISKNITINNLGTVTLTFNQKPENLYLNIDSTTTSVPKGWSTNVTTFGNGTPQINITNRGQTNVISK